ncbi:MAG: capsule assembly Wzi family protein [Chitinophagaceae bacterium]|nr:capsule assembly Wzi family protein [Chitinophagaceae bacterium]
MKTKIITFLLFLLLIDNVQAQTVWENHRSEVYPYLYRMAQKGLVDFSDMIRPVSREQIATCLAQLDSSRAKLSAIEKKELDFYLQEYQPIAGDDNTKLKAIHRDEHKRLRGLFYHGKNFQLNADPFGSIMQVSSAGKSFTQMSQGLQFWGKTGRWGFQFYYRDYSERGQGIDTFRKESPETGIIKVFNPSSNGQSFTEIRANISYSWKNGSLSFGKDHLLWGYGENGRIILSDKAPSYPYVRFEYQPLKWLRFNYTHAWLNSNIVDSNRSYGTGSGVGTATRILFVPKYMATHSLIFTPAKGLDIAIGESIVYSDQMDIGFLIPINFFKIYDNNRSNYDIRAGSNGQFFLQASSRNHIKNTHLYASLFVDEIRMSTIFNPTKSRNQLGYTLGGSVTDVLLPYLSLGAEYTRVNPFVYSNLIPAQNYTQYNQSLGDWMGNNFDRIILFTKYSPIPRLRLYARYQHIRKGGAGTLLQQYEAEPQPRFLFDFQKKRTDLFLQAGYEFINNFYITGSYQWLSQTLANGNNTTNNTIQLGISYGLR